MDQLRVGVIGTGRKKPKGDSSGYFMAYRHAEGFNAVPGCQVVACCDIIEANARAFAETFDLAADQVYLDYHQMLAQADLDIVCVCTWIHLHEPMVVDCCRAGIRAVHCEKPVAHTWGAALRMAAAAQASGTQVTFNHQRRYMWPDQAALLLLRDGAIGELLRMETSSGMLLDVGTHFFDLFGMFNQEQPAKWVLAQIDYRTENVMFGQHCDNQNLVLVEYANGVFGLSMSGFGAGRPAGGLVHLIGSDGEIRLYTPESQPILLRRAGDTAWRVPDGVDASVTPAAPVTPAAQEVVDCLASGVRPQIGIANALQTTEIIFAAYESVRRRGRVDLPLDIDDNPLTALVETGAIRPMPKAP